MIQKKILKSDGSSPLNGQTKENHVTGLTPYVFEGRDISVEEYPCECPAKDDEIGMHVAV